MVTSRLAMAGPGVAAAGLALAALGAPLESWIDVQTTRTAWTWVNAALAAGLVVTLIGVRFAAARGTWLVRGGLAIAALASLGAAFIGMSVFVVVAERGLSPASTAQFGASWVAALGLAVAAAAAWRVEGAAHGPIVRLRAGVGLAGLGFGIWGALTPAALSLPLDPRLPYLVVAAGLVVSATTLPSPDEATTGARLADAPPDATAGSDRRDER